MAFGVMILALRLMAGWASLQRLCRKGEPLAADLAAIVYRLRDHLKLSPTVRVMATDAANEPVAFGLFRPVVLVPISLMTSCPVELVEAWIAHELAHIRRYDLWVNLFQRVVETLLTSTPRLIACRQAWEDPWKREKIENLALMLTGAIEAREKVGLKMNVPRGALDGVTQLLPAEKSPTISDLADSEWVAVEVVLEEQVERNLVPQLKRAGASGIITYPLNKVIP